LQTFFSSSHHSCAPGKSIGSSSLDPNLDRSHRPSTVRWENDVLTTKGSWVEWSLGQVPRGADYAKYFR
jgi:hypothetical protein